jgi:AcrR family transcriptional regulator
MAATETKDRIIQASIRLFNIHGVSKVTLRQIAAEIGISHGNLAYHYKNTEVVLHEIYTRMEAEMATAVYPAHGKVDLVYYNALLYRISDFQRRHRFFYMDMLEITRRYPELIQRYRATIVVRREQTRQLFESLLAQKFLKPEPEPGFYLSLAHAIWVMSTFWLQQEKILGPEHPAVRAGNDIQHIWEILLPHLTRKGLRSYYCIQQSQQEHDD